MYLFLAFLGELGGQASIDCTTGDQTCLRKRLGGLVVAAEFRDKNLFMAELPAYDYDYIEPTQSEFQPN